MSATAVDAAGNVYLTGTFSNTVLLGTTILTSLGGDDVFVAKFNPATNQFVWAQRAGGTGIDYATALAVSGNNVYIAGYFSSPTAGFGISTLVNAGVNTSTEDVFVAKLTDAGSTGSFVWAQRAGGLGKDKAFALAASGTNVYVAGNFASLTAGFGTSALANAGTNTSTANTSTEDIFVAKLTDAGSTGSFAWAQRAGGGNDDGANALAVSGSGVYVAGKFRGRTADFGSVILTNINGSDAFVAKFTDAGSTSSFVWVQQTDGTGEDGALALSVSGTSMYVAGYFAGPTVAFGNTNLTNAAAIAATSDAFVAKLTDAGSTGSFVWAQRAGGTDYDMANKLVVSASNVYVAGDFASRTANFGVTTLTNAGTTGSFPNDVFAAQLTDAGSTGSFAWAQRAGGAGYDVANALAVSGSSLYVAGSFGYPTADFSAITLLNPNPNSSLGYLATLTDPTLTATAPSRTLAPAQLFPNPAHHTATLHLPAGTSPAPLVLTDALGRAVRRYPAPASPEVVLDLQDLPAGLYLLLGVGPAQRLAVE